MSGSGHQFHHKAQWLISNNSWTETEAGSGWQCLTAEVRAICFIKHFIAVRLQSIVSRLCCKAIDSSLDPNPVIALISNSTPLFITAFMPSAFLPLLICYFCLTFFLMSLFWKKRQKLNRKLLLKYFLHTVCGKTEQNKMNETVGQKICAQNKSYS